jgi:hypothetical protein
MKTNSTFRTFALVALLLSILNPQLSPCRAQGTAFTYQGRLNDAVAPANGIYDLTFALFNAGSGSGQVGGTQTNTALAVSNGLFTVTLDFGANFPGADRWLEMRVRTNGSGTFTTLAPRQKLTATPYAITAGDVTGANVARLNLSNTTVQATGHPIVTSGFITGAIVDSGGSGYTTAPSVIVNDSTGSGAIISATVSNGAVVSLTVNNAGSSYSPAATLTIGLPPNNAKQTFSGTNLFSGVNTLTNQNNVFAGDGSGLTGLWRLSGNAGTTPGTHFLGTTDNQPLEVRVNNRRALRIEPTTNSPNVIGGFSNNVVSGGATGATIGGGGSFGNANQVTANFGTIGGGRLNLVSGDISTVAGGYQNRIESAFASAIVGGENNRIVGPGAIINDGSFIGGGDDNLIWGPRVSSTISLGGASTIVGGNMNTIETNADFSFIGGGTANTIGTNSDFSTIGGGNQNVIAPNSFAATIPGGDSNAATNNAFAAGRRAKANHTGAFVWADSQNSDFASTDTNQFLIRASGGVGIGTTAPEADLHVFRGSAGAVTANATAPLVVESDANAYINILSPSDTTSGILFGSPLGSIDASIRYNNSGSGRELTFRTLNSQRMIITTNGDVGIGANIPDARLHVFDGSAGVVTANGNSVAVFERSG